MPDLSRIINWISNLTLKDAVILLEFKRYFYIFLYLWGNKNKFTKYQDKNSEKNARGTWVSIFVSNRDLKSKRLRNTALVYAKRPFQQYVTLFSRSFFDMWHLVTIRLTPLFVPNYIRFLPTFFLIWFKHKKEEHFFLDMDELDYNEHICW